MSLRRLLIASLGMLLLCANTVSAQPATSRTVDVSDLSASAYDSPLIALLLERSTELQLTKAQIKELEAARTEFQKRAIKQNSELRLAEIEFDELLREVPLNVAKVESKIRQVDALKTDIRVARLKPIESFKSQLTPAQQAKLAQFESAVASTPSGGYILESDLRQQIQAALKEQFQQQDVVEIRTTQAIAAKLFDWAKTFSIIAGVLLGIAGLVLVLLGVKTYKDFQSKVSAAIRDIDKKLKATKDDIDGKLTAVKQDIDAQLTGARASVDAKLKQTQGELEHKLQNAQASIEQKLQEVDRKLQEADDRAGAIKAEGESISAEYVQLRTQLADVSSLAQDVKQIGAKVKQIETFVFQNPSGLAPELAKPLEESLRKFEQYFEDLGFVSKKGPAYINVDPDHLSFPRYSSDRNTIDLAPIYATDTDVVFRLYAHYALVSLYGDDERNWNWNFAQEAIESGLAYYYVCSYSNTPDFGSRIIPLLQQKFPEVLRDNPHMRVRALENALLISQIDTARFGRITTETTKLQAYRDALAIAGEIWGGVCWDIRESLGQELADGLLFSAWRDLPLPQDGMNPFIKFAEGLIATARAQTNDQHAEQIRTIFKRRELSF